MTSSLKGGNVETRSTEAWPEEMVQEVLGISG